MTDLQQELAAMLRRRAATKRLSGFHLEANECENCALAVERYGAPADLSLAGPDPQREATSI